MVHLFRSLSVALLIATLFHLTVFPVAAQENNPGRCGGADVQQMLDDINKARVATRTLTPLLLNTHLCDMAYDQALIIAQGTHPLNNPLGRIHPSRVGVTTTVRDWVKDTGFLPYPNDEYAVSIGHFSTQAHMPAQVIGHIWQFGRADLKALFTDTRWREIGIAMVYSEPPGVSPYYHYVFILGTQPNVLPLIGYQPGDNEHIAISTFGSPLLSFWLSNENNYAGSADNVVGSIRRIRVDINKSTIEGIECPTGQADDAWMSYTPKLNFDARGAGTGPQTVYVLACDQIGRGVILETNVTIACNTATCVTVSANFSASPTSGEAPLTVEFADLSSGSISQWRWDFNADGEIDSTEQNPTFTFRVADDYVVRLTVVSADNREDFHEEVINVTSPPTPTAVPPVAVISATPMSGNAPLVVQFNSDGSTGEITSYVWDFDSDGFSDSNAANPQHRFSQPEEHKVSLTVTGPGGSHTETVTISVQQPIVIDANFDAQPAEGTVPLTVQFTDRSTGPVTTWAWDFDSDTFNDSTEQNPSYTYDVPGTYVAKLTVCDAANTCDSFEQNIIVNAAIPPCPVASFTASVLEGTAPLSVSFDSTSNGQIDLAVWDFQSDNVGDSDTLSTSHVYRDPGTYTARLTVTNACGSDSISQQIVVTAPATPTPPPVTLTATPTTPVSPEPTMEVATATPTVESPTHIVPTNTPTAAVQPSLTPSLTPISEPTVDTHTPTTTPRDFEVPLTFYWTEDYAVLKNTGDESIEGDDLLSLEFAGANSSTFAATRWNTDDALDALHPGRCLVAYRTGEAYPGLDQMRQEARAHCDTIKVRATGPAFWDAPSFVIRRDGLAITTCSDSPCVFDLLDGGSIAPTPQPAQPTAMTQVGRDWLMLTWNNEYVLLRNVSGQRIDQSELDLIAIHHPNGTFEGSRWNTPGLDPRECMVIIRNDTTAAIDLNNFLTLDSGCIRLDGEATSIHPFWIEANTNFTVRANGRDLATCSSTPIRGECTVSAP